MKLEKSKSGSRKAGARRRDSLAKLRPQFDALIEHMQTPEHKAAVDALFAATAAEIGAVAAAQAREGVRLRANSGQENVTAKRLPGQLMNSTARACAVIDDAVAYVKASNRNIARLEKKKKR